MMKKVWLIFLFGVFCSVIGHGQSIKETEANTRITAEQKQKIKVFPNPATTLVNILGLKNSQRADISISDVYGTIALSYQWQIKNNALNIPISSLDSGIYLISIRSQEQQVQGKFYKK